MKLDLHHHQQLPVSVCLALRDAVSGGLPTDTSQRRGRPAVWPRPCTESGTTEILLVVEADNVCQLLSQSDPVIIAVPISLARFFPSFFFLVCPVVRTLI